MIYDVIEFIAALVEATAVLLIGALLFALILYPFAHAAGIA